MSIATGDRIAPTPSAIRHSLTEPAHSAIALRRRGEETDSGWPSRIPTVATKCRLSRVLAANFTIP